MGRVCGRSFDKGAGGVGQGQAGGIQGGVSGGGGTPPEARVYGEAHEQLRARAEDAGDAGGWDPVASGEAEGDCAGLGGVAAGGAGPLDDD